MLCISVYLCKRAFPFRILYTRTFAIIIPPSNHVNCLVIYFDKFFMCKDRCSVYNQNILIAFIYVTDIKMQQNKKRHDHSCRLIIIISFNEQIAHTFQADCQSGCVMEQRRSCRHNDTCNTQHDQTGIDPNNQVIVPLDAFHQQIT